MSSQKPQQPRAWTPGWNPNHWAAKHCRQFIPCWSPGEWMHDVSGNGNHVQRINSDGTSARAVAPFGLAAKIERPIAVGDYYRPVNDLYLTANSTLVCRAKLLPRSSWVNSYACIFGSISSGLNMVEVLVDKLVGHTRFRHKATTVYVAGVDWTKFHDLAYTYDGRRGKWYLDGQNVADIAGVLNLSVLPRGTWGARSRGGYVEHTSQSQFGYMGMMARAWTANQVMRFRDDPWGLCRDERRSAAWLAASGGGKGVIRSEQSLRNHSYMPSMRFSDR